MGADGSCHHWAVNQADETRGLLAAALATALLAGSGRLGPGALLGAVAVVQAAVIVTWALAGAPPAPTGPSYSGGPVVGPALPGRGGALVIGVAAAVAADAAVLTWPHGSLSAVLFVLGLVVPAMFVHQLTRGVVRARVVESLSGIAVVVVCVVALSALVQLRHNAHGSILTVAALVATGAAVVVAGLVDLVFSRPRYDPDVPRGFTATVVATAAGTFAGVLALDQLDRVGTATVVLLCAAAAASAALVCVGTGFLAYGSADGRADSADGRARLFGPVAVGIMPLALSAPAAYVLLLCA